MLDILKSNQTTLHEKSEDLIAPHVAISVNDEGLLPASALTGPIEVTFPAWANVMEGISYQLLWDDRLIGDAKLIEKGTQPGTVLAVDIPVHALTEGKHRLAYRLTTLENGTTNDSPSSSVEVDRTPPGNPLIAPILFPDQTQDGLTSEELEGMGNVLRGTIASYKGMQEGDVIHTYWNTIPGPTAVVSKDDMGLKRIMIDFARLFLESIGDIEAPVHYTITDLAGNLSMRSESVSVKLQLTTVTPLPTPTVKEATGGTLDPANASSGATVVIDAAANLKTGDQVIVQWQGPKGSDTREKTLTGADAGKALEVLFAAVLVTANAGQTVAVSYVVNRTNGLVQTSDTLALQILAVTQELVLDTSPVTLAGKIYLIPGTPDLLPSFPANTTVQRQASGGQAPYSYASGNPLVAKVDANGLVSVRGKGATTITATDALGARKSYPVSVTGVIHCVGVGTGSFSQVSKAASNIGARIPSIQELVDIHAAYGNRWPMGNGNYWSSTVSHTNLVGWYWYYVKNLVTGGTFKLKSHNSSVGVAVK